MADLPPRPAFDPEFDPRLISGDRDRQLDDDAWVAGLRAEPTERTAEEAIAGRPIHHLDFDISGDGTGPLLSIFRREELTGGSLPCLYLLHGGGFVSGTRFSDLALFLDWVLAFPVAVASLEYRLAPEHPGAVPFDDSFRGLQWILDNAAELEVDGDRLVIAGSSAGGGLAASVALTARDSGGPRAIALLLMSPMLDHRNSSVSAAQFRDAGNWTSRDNEQAWNALLPQRQAASPYASISPSHASRLDGLPPTYIDVGSAEVFRDEGVEFATRIWAAGGQAELHVWDGGFHCFELVQPAAALSRRAWISRNTWLARVLGVDLPLAPPKGGDPDAQ
jgi:acetyl esterase/lipase